MKAILSIIIGVSLICPFYLARGQSPADSLLDIIAFNTNKPAQTEALSSYEEQYLQDASPNLFTSSEKLIDASKESGYSEGLIAGYSAKSAYFYQKVVYDSVIYYCDRAISIADSIGKKAKLAELYRTKGLYQYRLDGASAGLEAYRKSYQLYAELGDSLEMANSLNGVGVMFLKIPKYDSAAVQFFSLIDLCQKMGYEEILGKALLNLGIVFQQKIEPDKARRYLLRSIEVNRKYNDRFVATANLNLGIVSHDIGKLDSALYYYDIAMQFFSEMNSIYDMANTYNSMGNVMVEKGDYDQGYIYFLKASDIYLQLGDKTNLAKALLSQGNVHHNKGNYQMALSLYDSAITLADTTHSLELLKKLYNNKFTANYNLGHYKKALENLITSDYYKDSIFNIEKEKVISEYEIKYRTKEKEAENLALEKEKLKLELAVQIKEKQRKISLFTGIGIIILVTFILLYLRQRAVKDRIIAQQRVRQLEEEKKLLAARSLVEGQEEERKRIARELHDGLGVLLSTTKMQFSVIKDKSPENLPLIERASKLLEQASSDVRKISHNMMPGLLTKFGLFDAVEDLFDKVSETEGLKVRADIPEEAERLPENKEIMLYRIVQELVNNTLKHAGAKNIEIQMQVLDDRLDIIYSDDGKGFNVDEKMESKSIGLTSIQSRVNFLNGKMHVQSSPGKGVTYKIEVPK